MKQRIILGMVSMVAIATASITVTCPVIITNDTGKVVQVTTNDTQKPKIEIQPGQEGNFGNHANHVEFTILKQSDDGQFAPLLSVKQLECAKRLAQFTVNSLLNRTFFDGQQIHPAKFEITKFNK